MTHERRLTISKKTTIVLFIIAFIPVLFFAAFFGKTTVADQEALAVSASDLGYVTDGLKLCLDGINNTRSGHSSNTSTWQDLSGNNYDFTISGASITSKSLSFDGTDDFAYLNNGTALTGGKESTVEIVFKATSSTKNVILFQDPQSYDAFGIGSDNRGIIHGSSDTYKKQVISDRPVFAWNKILSYSVAYYDYTSTSAFVCYADGVRLDGRGGDNSWSYGTSNYKCIGCRDYTSDYDKYFYKGEIYAIRVYNRALTEAEQLRNYNLDVKRFESQNRTDQGYVKDGLVLQLDGIVNTRSGHNNNATTWEDISGSGTNYDFDMHNCSVSEDGVTFNGISSANVEPSYAYCNNTTNLAGSSGLTMEVVYVSDSLPTDSCMVYSDGSSNVCVSNYYSGSEKWLILAMNLSYTKYSLLNSKSSVPNVFHNVSVSYTSVTANNQFVADVDGSPYETWTSGTHYHEPISGYTGKILGAIEGNKNQSNMAFFGKIYAVRVYNRSLTAGERRMNYERDVERFSLSTEDELGYAKDGMRLWLDGEKNTRAGHSASTGTWEDLSGYGYDFTMSNCSIGDRYFGFNGSSSCGQRASAPNLAAGETLTLEITLLCNLPAETYQIVFMDNVSCAGLGWTSMTSVITAAAPGGGKTRDISNNTGFEVSKLLTYSITYTGSGSNNYNLYINNTLCSKGSGTDQWNRTNTTNMWIGRRGEGESGAQYWFNGNIYAIRIYNRTLTNYERTMNYQLDRERFLPQSTDVGYVKDGMTLWLDGEHNTREGHSTSSSTWQNLAPTGSAYDYTLYNCIFGTNNIGFNNTGYGKCTNTGYLSGTRSNTATLEIVLYGNGKNGSQIVFRDVDSHIGFGSTTSTLIFSASDGDTYTKRVASGTIASGAVTLYSIAYNDVITKSTADFSVKVNNSNLALASSGTDYWGIRNGRKYKTVGAREETTDFDGFNGSIYCVRVYNRALSDEERYQNYLVDRRRFFGSTVYDVEEDIDGVSLSGQKLAQANTAYSAKLVAGDSVLPSELVVKAGNTTLTSGTHYTYNSSTGALTINASSVTGKIKICAKRSVVFPSAQTGYTIYNDSGTALSGTKTIGSEYGVRFKVTANTASGYAVTKVTAAGKELIAKNGYYYIDKYTSAPTIAVTTCSILKLESITPVNNQYYNTGVEPNDHTGGKVTFMSTATGNTMDDNVLSSRNYDDGQHPANRFYVPYLYGNNYKWVYGDNRLYYINDTTGGLNTAYTVSINYNDDRKAVVASGSSADLPDKHFNINRYGLYIANYNCGGGPIADSNLIGRIYEVYITQDSTVTHHYIPVLDSNNNACLYDVENNVFLYHGGGSTMGFRLFVTVTLDNANATTSGTSSVSALYGSAMPTITAPARTGYNFSGYFNATSGGVKYYNADGSSAKNWDVIAKTAMLNTQWTLSPISVSSQPSAINKTYDGNNSTLTYTVSHALTKTYQWYKGGSPISGATAASLTVKNVSDSGSYYCVATVTDSGNTVTSTSNTVTVTVGQKELTFNAISTGGSYVYNGQDAWENRAACSVSGMVGSETLKVLVSRNVGTYLTGYDYPTTQEWTQNGIACGQYGTRASGAALYFGAKDVGSWSIAVVGVDSGSGNVNNYKWATNSDTDAERTLTFTVTAKEVTLSWGTASFIYDGGSHKPTCAAGALCSGDSCAVTVIGEQVNAGEYAATASALSNGNYKLPSGKTKAFEITQKEVTLSWGETSFVYDKISHAPTCVAGALCSGDSCTVTVTGEQTNAGDYTATASALSNGNYKLPSVKTKAFEITQKEVTLSWGETSFVYDKISHAPTCVAESLCEGDTCIVTVTGEQINVGDYVAMASSISNANYKLPTANTKAFEITPKEIGLSWSGVSLTYNGNAQAPSCVATGVCEGDECVVTVTGAQTDRSEFAYTATASIDNDNYKLPSIATTSFEIAAKDISGATIVLDELDLVYNGGAQTQTVVSVAIDGLSATFTVSDNEATSAGEYVLTVTGTGNYCGSETAGYSIAKKEAALLWTAPADLIYSNSAKIPSVVVSNLETGDECKVVSSLTDGKDNVNVGFFTFTATALDNDNYKLPTSPVSPEYEITRKNISGAEVVLGEALTYNGQEQTKEVVSVTIDGLSATFTVSDNEATSAGEYVLTVTGTGNYCGSETAGYSIAKKKAVLLWTAPADLIYSNSAKIPSVVVSNLETGDECKVVSSLTDGEDNVNVGIFTFTATALDNDNYKLPPIVVSPEYEVVRKNISGAEITLGAFNTYNGQIQTQEVISVITDGLSVTYETTENVRREAGDYVLTVTGTGNYCGSETKEYSILRLSIASAAVVLGESLTYDGTDQTQAISSVTIDDLVVTYEVSGDVACHAGDYVLTLVGTGNYTGNKDVEYTVGKKALTIKANDSAVVYGNAPVGNGVSYTGLVAGDELIGTLDYDYTYSTYGAIGTYALTPKGLTSGDYEITFAAGALTVNKKPVSAVLHAENVTYGSVVEASAEFVEGSIVNNDDVPILLTYTGVLDSGETYEESTEKPTMAGTYILWAKLSDEGDSHNYSMTQSVQFSITKADYQVNDIFSFSDAEFYYDGTEHFLYVVKKEQNDIVVTYENNGRTAVGSQTVVAKFSGYDENNYNAIADMEATLTVLARNISGAEIVLSGSLTYNGEEQTQLVSSVHLTLTIEGEPVVLDVPEYTVSSNTGTNAGDYALTVTASGNFSGSQTAAFSIAKKNIAGAEIVLGARNVYNGREQTQTVTSVTVDGLMIDTFYLSGNVQTDVGASDYVLTVTAGGQNFTGTATKTWNVERKDVTFASVTLGSSLIYNGTEQTQNVASVEIDGLSATFDVSGNKETLAGNYVLTVTGTGNYRGSREVAYRIAKKALTIRAADFGIIYGDEPANGGVIYDGFVGGEDESDLGGEAQYAYSYVRYGNVGGYTITVSGFTSDNYEISYQQGVLTVERYEVTLDWDQSVIRYTGSIRYPSATVVTLNGDECLVTVTGGGTTAGRYTAEAVSLSNGNYVLPVEATIEFDVLPALIVPPLPTTETYVYTGEEIVYRFGSDAEPTYTVNGNRRTESGSQEVVLSIRDKTNYCWADTETTEDKGYLFTVEKRRIDPPVLTEKPYNGRVQTATVPENSYYKYTDNDGGIDVGTYDVTLEMIDDNCGWTGTEEREVVVGFSIVRANNIWSIYPYANDGVYGAAFLPASGAARFGRLTIRYRLRSATDDDYSSAVPTYAGEYYALVTVEETENYTGLSERLSFMIDKATFDTSNFGWDYEEPFTYDGSEKRINVVGLPSGVRATLSDNVKTAAGEYTATAELVYDTNNYHEISLDPCVWVIEAQSISATWTMATYTYSGSEFALPTARYYGRGFQLDLNVEERDGKTFLNAGEYLFVASSPDDNYVVSENKTQTFTVKKRKIVVPAENKTKFFCTGEEQTYSISASAFYTLAENVRTEAGSQNVRVVLNDKVNTEWATGSSEDLLFVFTIEHRFSAHNGDESKLVKEATCTESAVYYAECVCGDKEEYSYGDPLGHEYKVEFVWHEGYTATAHISCERCDHEAEAEAEITYTKEDLVEWYHATITLGGKTFTDSKRKGAAVYRDHVYGDPVWTWNRTDTGYETEVVFYACDGSDLTQELTADVSLTETEEKLLFVATVYFGDTNKKFTDEKTIDKVHFTVCWTENDAYAAYVWPDRPVSEFLRNAPAQDGYTLYAFRTDEGVYLPNAEEFLSAYKTKGSAMTLTALWQGRGSIVLSAEDEEGNRLEDVFFSLAQNGASLFEGSTDRDGNVTFGRVPFGAYNLIATFMLSGKQITRSYSVTISHAREERTIALEQSRVSTEINGPISAENLEEVVSEKTQNASVTIVVDTAEKPSEETQNAMKKKADDENKGHTLIDFFDLTVTEKIKTVDENGSVNEQNASLSSSGTPILLRMPLAEEIFARLIERNGTLDDVIVYACDKNGSAIGKLPKKEYARDGKEYYYVETSGSVPYVVLSTNRFVSFAVGIQDTVVQAVNDFISLAIDNWVYGTGANSPQSSVKFGRVKYLYASKDDGAFSETVPTKAGTYLLKAYVEAEEEYTAAERVIEFVVEKATYNMRNVSFGDLYVIADGSRYSIEIKGELPEGVTVVYEGNVQSETGEYVAVAHFFGDTENYNVISDKTANLVIQDQKQLIWKRYWWAFAAAGAFLLIVLLVPIFRPKGKRGGLMFNYRIGG